LIVSDVRRERGEGKSTPTECETKKNDGKGPKPFVGLLVPVHQPLADFKLGGILRPKRGRDLPGEGPRVINDAPGKGKVAGKEIGCSPFGGLVLEEVNVVQFGKGNGTFCTEEKISSSWKRTSAASKQAERLMANEMNRLFVSVQGQKLNWCRPC